MQLKTFTAPDLATALSRAQREMGPGALVLATNEIRGHLGLSRVEITVGVDRSLRPDDGQVKQLASEVELLRRRLERNELDEGRLEPPAAPVADHDELNPALRAAVDTLGRAGLSRDLTCRFARCASRAAGTTSDSAGLALAAERAMDQLLPCTPSPLNPRALFVVGPPGAGKTTSVAKLVARIGRQRKGPVIFAQSDLLRTGSIEESDLHCRRLGVRLAPVETPDDLDRVRELSGRRGSVIVDTSGIGSGDADRLKRLGALRRRWPRAQVALLIPAGLHHEEARTVLDRFAEVRPTCVAFSKVDDGSRIGELVTATAPVGLPLGFLTTGHRVPDDLEDASPRALTAWLLRSGFRGSAPREMS